MLIVDIGNTDIVIGVCEDDRLIHTFRIPSLKNEDQSFFAYQIINELFEANIDSNTIQLIVISSVVPELNTILDKAFQGISNAHRILVRPGIHPKIKVNIENQEELGSDIYCNAVAAFTEFQKACIVVDFGTALTVTGIDDSGEIQGVAIAPGLKTAVKSLFSNTAQLPEVPLELPISALGKNTVTAIQSGVLYGYEGMVKNLTEKFKSELGPHAKTYVTGGLSSIIPGIKEFTTKTDINLTLRGLIEIGKLYL